MADPARQTVRVLVRDPQERVLVVEHKGRPGMWVLPGGRVEASDPSLRDAAARELYEETGLQGLSLYHRGPFEGTNCYLFEVVNPVPHWRPKQMPGEQQIRWATLEQLRDPTFTPFARLYEAAGVFESD